MDHFWFKKQNKDVRKKYPGEYEQQKIRSEIFMSEMAEHAKEDTKKK